MEVKTLELIGRSYHYPIRVKRDTIYIQTSTTWFEIKENDDGSITLRAADYPISILPRASNVVIVTGPPCQPLVVDEAGDEER